MSAGRLLIHICDFLAGIPLAFTDIHRNMADYEGRRTPSFTQLLVAKSMARYVNNADIVSSWYTVEGAKLIESTAVSSLRWMDIYELQKPAFRFAEGATGTSQLCSQNFVVGNAAVIPTPIQGSTDADVASKQADTLQADTKMPLPSTAAGRMFREKMDLVDSWMKDPDTNKEQERVFNVAAKMHMEASKVVVVDAGSQSGNDWRDSRASQAKRETCEAVVSDNRASGVPLQSSAVTSSASSNGKKPRQSRNRLQMDDMPEKDMNRHDQTKPNWTGTSPDSCSIDGFVNVQLFKTDYVKKSSTPSSGESKTRLSFRDGQPEKPLFLLDDDAHCDRRSYGRADSKADLPEIPNFVSPKCGRGNTVGSYSPEFCASDVSQKEHAKTSPLSANTETKMDLPLLKPCDEETAASTSSKKLTLNKESLFTASVHTDLDDQPHASAKEQLCPLITETTFCESVTNTSGNHDTNKEEDLRSECSMNSVTAVEKHVESDGYLTANESSSTVSVTPRKKANRAPEASPAVTPSPEISRRESSVATDEETVVSNACAAAEKPTVSRAVAPVTLEIPESRQVTVLVSDVESPDRFWVNIPSEECIQLDHVIEVLNSNMSSLKPVDTTPGTIELHQCYCLPSVHDGLVYRAEVVEICYGDSRCKRSSMDNSAVCQCDQLMRHSATAAKAVKVHHLFVARFLD